MVENAAWCGQAVSQSGLEVAREQDRTLTHNSAAEAGERAVALADLREYVDSNPILRQALGIDD